MADFVAPTPRQVLTRLALGLLGLLVAVAALGILLRGPIEALSGAFVEEFGLPGLFAAVFVLDFVPVGTHDPALLAAWAGGLPFVPTAALGMAGTVLAICAAWACGRVLGDRAPALRRLADRWQIPALLRHYGTQAVVIAALLPVPFALVAWTSGAVGGSFAQIALGAGLRSLKVVLTLSLVALGWSVGA